MVKNKNIMCTIIFVNVASLITNTELRCILMLKKIMQVGTVFESIA